MSYLLIVGQSGSGKSTLASIALEALRHASLVTSTTTRKRRPSDLPGEYSYVSQEEFNQLSAKESEFLDIFNHAGEYYATRLDDILKFHFQSDPHIRIAILVPRAVPIWLKLLKQRGYVLSRDVHVVFVETQSDGYRIRLERRGDDPATIENKIVQSQRFKQELFDLVPNELISTLRNDGSVEEFKAEALRLFEKLDL